MIDLREEPFTAMPRHAAIPSAYDYLSVFDVLEAAEGHQLCERPLARPHRKEYDLLEDPLQWSMRFDVTNWALIGAYEAGARVGGAIAAFDTPEVDMLEGRSDLVVLWDMRVAHAARRRGVGSALFQAVEAWGRKRRCSELKVETQNTNVAACRLYARQGCTLSQANRGAYAVLPDEIQLI
jgi:GNAT superfamily N-acetyltransferase